MKLPSISLATSVRYGNYKEHLTNALFFIDLLADKYNTLKQYIVLPRNLSINFRPVRDAYGRAFYITPTLNSAAREYIVEIDIRQDLKTFKDTIIHELVHIEQFYEGRLKAAGNMHFKWNGKKMLIDTSSTAAYSNLPWELEASNRARLLNRVVFN